MTVRNTGDDEYRIAYRYVRNVNVDAISSIGHNGRRDEQFNEDFYIVTAGTVHDEALLQSGKHDYA
ncbi:MULTISPECIES: hypothetical protein [Paenibacillus]|uniref:Uncharacterized protein n=1 Tax=Paenibacillus cucumis (ex Kampfer et al. 2016) TaxID=1776858 RepID=A0ABS7KC08_9BACL|nr:hypothetical protein [Paenibacillus cucumis (ex Kampfer et al. 2016)]MBY0201678.1 hypothetical protein [Paenibacillus cucumis (ex Kampfer et al. 2016)]MDP9698911.1 hypothetical protein [Paenibacillus intestini]